MMDMRQYIESQTRNNEEQKLKSKPKFKNIKKVEKPIKSPRIKGEKPTMLEDISNYNTDSPNSKQNLKQKQANKKQTLPQSSSSEDNCDMQFAGIISSVREVCGGRNTQSNEVIERRHKQRQKELAGILAESDNASSTLTLDATQTTESSKTTDSYKTALQDSFNSRSLDQQQTSSTVIKDNPLERYKKNALMKGLLQDAANNCPDKDESSTECSSSDFMDASNSINDIQSDLLNLNIHSDGDNMSQELIYRLLQSREDEDVFVHPLKEGIQNDPDWQKQRLERKGIEITQTPRQYYMNLDDDGFAFGTKQ